jgi:hypothetical protein
VADRAHSTQGEQRQGDPDAEFEFGLGLMLDGIAARLAR